MRINGGYYGETDLGNGGFLLDCREFRNRRQVALQALFGNPGRLARHSVSIQANPTMVI